MWGKKTYRKAHWVDEFIRNVKPYIFVREEDMLLIKMPNQATKLNQTGVKVLKYLLDGHTFYELEKVIGKEKQTEILQFLIGVKKYLEGNLDEFSCNPAVTKEPFNKDFSKYPVLSELAITYRCNLACTFCYAGCNCTTNPAFDKHELSVDELKTIVTNIYKDAKVPSISFTGGEPTLRDSDLLILIRHARKLGMRVNLITNGTRIDEKYAAELKEAGLNSAQISIEGTSALSHDRITKTPGSFEKSIRSVRLLKELDIHVHTNTTLCRDNISEAHLFPSFVKNVLGLERFSMNMIIPTGSWNFHKENYLPYSEIGAHLKKIIEISDEQEVEFMWYSPVPMCMFNTIIHGLGNKGCAACDGLLSVAPNGDILPCASFDEPVGNLKETPFKNIWHSERPSNIRNKDLAHDICKECEHFHLCHGACPLYWRSIGHDELLNQRNTQKQKKI